MKNSKMLVMAALTAIITGSTSCNKTEVPSIKEGNPAVLHVNVCSARFTKASLSEDNEKKVDDVQILVFRKDGELDAYAKSSATENIKISCTTGAKDIFALANAPDLSSVSKLSEYNDMKSSLSDNSLDHFVMTGKVSMELGASSSVSIPVKRIVSRISIDKVAANFTSAAYKAKEFKVTGIYVVNVAGDINYKGDSEPTIWYNKMKHETSAVDNLLYEKIQDGTVTAAAPYSRTSCFYVYPNGTAEDSQAEAFSARHTRLVVETTLGGITYYYPVTIPQIESNKTYSVKALTVTRPGSLSPDIPVSSAECTFSISVSDWEEGSSEDYTI